MQLGANGSVQYPVPLDAFGEKISNGTKRPFQFTYQIFQDGEKKFFFFLNINKDTFIKKFPPAELKRC